MSNITTFKEINYLDFQKIININREKEGQVAIEFLDSGDQRFYSVNDNGYELIGMIRSNAYLNKKFNPATYFLQESLIKDTQKE
jgi:hypothetical protein